jgi:hypothetical protein
MIGIAIACAALAQQDNAPGAAVGTVSSTDPVTINGTAMSPAAAPSWPLAPKDEIANTAPARIQTADRNVLTLDANSRARISSVGNSQPYIYVRQGGVQFNAANGPVYICIGDRLYVPTRSAQGSVRINSSGTVVNSLQQGTFAEQGTRPCTPDAAGDFLSGLPRAAGGSIGPAPPGGGLSTSTKVAIGVTAAEGGAAALAYFLLSRCSSSNGCNFNPASISASQP